MIYSYTIEAREKKKIRKLRSSAMDRAKRVADCLKKKYGASRVVLFGSLVRKRYLHERSDIDLLVEGLKKYELLRAGFEASNIAKPFNVDLIPYSIADPSIIKIANEEGIVL